MKRYDYYKVDSSYTFDIPKYCGIEDSDGKVTIIGCNYNLSNATLNLSSVSDIDGNPHIVKAIGNKAFYYVKLTDVVIDLGSSVKTIGDYAFSAEKFAKSISYNEDDNGVTSIGGSAFRTVVINGNFKTNATQIGSYAFYEAKFTNVNIFSFVDGCSFGQQAFRNIQLNNLKTLTFGDNCTFGYQCFVGTSCSDLETLTFGNNCNFGQEAFLQIKFTKLNSFTFGNGCIGATSIFKETSFSISSLINFNFGHSCNGFASLFYLSKINASVLKFNVASPVLSTDSVTTFGQSIFTDATAADNSLWIFNGLETIPSYSFIRLKGSVSLNFVGTKVSASDNIYNSSKIISMSFDNSLQIFGGKNALEGCSSLNRIVFTRTSGMVTNSNGTDVKMPTNVKIYVPVSLYSTYISATGWDNFASNFNKISNIIDGWSYTIVSGNDIRLTEYNGSTAISGGVLTVPSQLTDGVNTYNVTQLGADLLNTSSCVSVTSIKIPASVSYIDPDMFGTEQFTSLAISEVQIEATSPYYRAGTNIVSGYSVGDRLESADGIVLYKVISNSLSNGNITTITLDYRTIIESALVGCTTLTDVTFGSIIAYLPDDLFAFSGCNVKTLTFTSTTPPVAGSNAFGSMVYTTIIGNEFTQQVASGCAIYVPVGSENAYKAAPGFAAYAIAIQTVPNP